MYIRVKLMNIALQIAYLHSHSNRKITLFQIYAIAGCFIKKNNKKTKKSE
jgi:hypothetical protein